MHGSHSGKQRKPKKAKIKKEKDKEEKREPPEEEEERDLTHYIRDRVALMKQVFCVLRERELLAMAPSCLRGLAVDDLQELCLDEVLGISSKRLRATLDGYECPSDTDSSQASQPSPLHQLETISLDSISSEDEQLAVKAKPKKKSRHHSKHKKRESEPGEPEQPTPRGPAGMTVLELLELQARARAIRAQLQAVRINTGSDAEKDSVKAEDDSVDEVLIKEEPPEVVEVVSSEDDGKPDQNKAGKKTFPPAQSSPGSSFAKDKTWTDPTAPTLVVSMPATSTQQPPRKIKLNRNNLLVSVSNVTKPSKPSQESPAPVIDLDKDSEVAGGRSEKTADEKEGRNEEDQSKECNDKEGKDAAAKQANKRLKNKGHGKISKKRKSAKSKGSDEDEIMLELSDTEKMDLLDSFNSESSSETESGNENVKAREELDSSKGGDNKNDEKSIAAACTAVIDLDSSAEVGHGDPCDDEKQTDLDKVIVERILDDDKDANVDISTKSGSVEEVSENLAPEENDAIKTSDKGDLENDVGDEIRNDNQQSVKPDSQSSQAPDSVRECDVNVEERDVITDGRKKKKKSKKSKDSKRRSSKAGDRVQKKDTVKSSVEDDDGNLAKKKLQNTDKHLENSQHKIGDVSEGDGRAADIVGLGESVVDDKVNPGQELSEGECSYSSDGIEITELKHDIVCISDEKESDVDSIEAGKPRRKKYRKRKNSSNSSDEGGNRIDGRISAVENEEAVMEVDSISSPGDPMVDEEIVSVEEKNDSYEEDTPKRGEIPIKKEYPSKGFVTENAIDVDEYEVFEISDDSSGDETGNCLSKEPTTEEIEELSRKIDTEIEREEIVFEKNITGDVDDETKQEILRSVGASGEELADSSWKERWLKSDKVKKVLATSNLCNALRKKNKELKMKLVEASSPDVGRKLSSKHQSGTTGGVVEDKTDDLDSGDKTADGCRENIDNESAIKEVEDANEDRLQVVISDTDKKEIGGANDSEKIKQRDVEENIGQEESTTVDVGSVDFYMTLASSTRYVDHVRDPEEERRKAAMAKDARQLMKMYRRLLKIHRKAEGGGKKEKKKKKKDKQKKSAGKDKVAGDDKDSAATDVR